MTDTKTPIDENMTERVIDTVLSSKFNKLFKKYIVKLSYTDGKEKVHWMTEEQLNQLMQCMSHIPSGHSSKDVYITAVSNESKGYRFAKLYYTNQEKDK